MSTPFISLRKFRHPSRVKAWLSAGETIDLVERGKVIARIIPEKPEEAPVTPSSTSVEQAAGSGHVQSA